VPCCEHESEIAVFPREEENSVVCALFPADNGTAIASQLRQISLVISQQAQARNGVLLHGALTEWQGNGIVLAGRSGIGKTTASRRLVSPWKSLSDDLTLVVQDIQGEYWAHPWPTWSQFMADRSGGSWNVQDAVPLKGIFFLSPAQNDWVEPIGAGRAVGLLVKACGQARWGMPENVGPEQKRRFRLQCFENICPIAQTISCHMLHVSLNGEFWHELEKAIA
jgi:SynChlorMet cassette protein ScmC